MLIPWTTQILSQKQRAKNLIQQKSTYQKVLIEYILHAMVLGIQICKSHLSIMKGDN